MTPTPKELVDASEHIRYEFEMLLSTAIELFDLSTPRIQYEINKNNESFIAHTRNMIDFLYIDSSDKRIRSTDIVAFYYTKDLAQWIAKRGDMPDLLNKAKYRADKELAHITTERKAGISEDKIWDKEAITDKLFTDFKLFLSLADEDKFNEQLKGYGRYLAQFDNYKRAARDIMGRWPPIKSSTNGIVYKLETLPIDTNHLDTFYPSGCSTGF